MATRDKDLVLKKCAFFLSLRRRRDSIARFDADVTRLVSRRHLHSIANKVGGCRWRIDRGMRDSAGLEQSLSQV